MTANPIASMTSDALAIAEASADELRVTIEHLHGRLAIARAEAESHLERIDAADQHARTIDAALAHEREAGRGLVAQVEHWRSVGDRIATIAGELFGPFPVQSPDEDLTAIERGAYDGIRAAQELAAIRDLVAPGNPQGAVVDAVRTTMHALGLVRADRDRAGAEIAKLRAEVAELRARPVLTVEALAGAVDASIALSRSEGGARKVAESIMAKLGPVTLPSPDRAEELARADYDARNNPGDFDRCRPEMRNLYIGSMRAALAKLSPAPAREAAPTLVAVSDEELRDAYLNDPDDTLSGIRAVRAKLGAAEVTEERVKAALHDRFKHEGYSNWSADARAILDYLRATVAKEHDRG